MAEKYYSVSPYAFCNNNPVIFVDPEGEETIVVTEGGFRPHAFLIVRSSEGNVLYTYGRYGAIYPVSSNCTFGRFTPCGEGILEIKKGRDACDYLENVCNSSNFSMFWIDDTDDVAIKDYYTSLFENGVQSSNADKPSFTDVNAKVIDDYNIFNNNCVVKTLEGLKHSGINLKSDAKTPWGLKKDLQKTSLTNPAIIMINKPSEYIKEIMEEFMHE